MSRIRSIHPGLHTDDDFMAVTAEAPLAAVLLPGLWCEADDQGVFLWKPATLKARVLPNVNADVTELLGVLERHRFVLRFTAEGREYGAIRNFRRWQRPKKPTALYLLPEELRTYVGLSAASSEPVPHSPPTAGEKSQQMEEVGGRREDGGEEGETKGEERAPVGATPPPPDPPPSAEPLDDEAALDLPPMLDRRPASARGTRLPADWSPPPDSLEFALTEGLPEEDFHREAAKFRDYFAGASGSKGTKLDWSATWRNWLRRAADDRRARPAHQRAGADRHGSGGVVGAVNQALAVLARREGQGGDGWGGADARPHDGPGPEEHPAGVGGGGVEILPPRRAAGTG